MGLDSILENTWIVITIFLPGLATFGFWRLLLLLQPSERLHIEAALSLIDRSTITSISIIAAISLLQQSVGIALEAFLALIATWNKNTWKNFHALMCRRFELVSSNTFSEKTIQTIANFFSSLNLCVGLVFIMLYYILYEGLPFDHWVVIMITTLLCISISTAIFRFMNAIWAVKSCLYKEYEGSIKEHDSVPDSQF